MVAHCRGYLVLVVGPSGAGKDSILAGARAALAADDRFQFVRREITRPGDAGGENHMPVTWDEFRARSAGDEYALSWEAHGCGYGVSASALRGLAHGQSAVANVSRGVLDFARTRFSPVRVIQITIPQHTLAPRLSGRGRESAEEIAHRLARAASFHVNGDDVLTIVNDGPLDRSVSTFVAALQALPESG
jgi:phosphonate metabolism protein PhnN/1,5-bisphosphokinase (PRPP-forming)